MWSKGGASGKEDKWKQVLRVEHGQGHDPYAHGYASNVHGVSAVVAVPRAVAHGREAGLSLVVTVTVPVDLLVPVPIVHVGT